ncbi:glyoxalase [Opitutaceae bacterium EW11]|nr:glyoxalase [Opitutaceae bacterium EW11]
MKTPTKSALSLGYVILYVPDVAASLAFYEKAFGFSRGFLSDNDGKAYGELKSGTVRLAFASLAMAREVLKQDVVTAQPGKPPLGVEIAFTTSDVAAAFECAVKAGAVPVSSPEKKPWGQTIAYVRDNCGYLVELCTPLP